MSNDWAPHRPTLPNCGAKGVTVMVKVKVQFTLEQATKAQMGSRGITPLFL
jgi:hypothetical protein